METISRAAGGEVYDLAYKSPHMEYAQANITGAGKAPPLVMLHPSSTFAGAFELIPAQLVVERRACDA